ncbi:hypothetical protein [Pseudanabaena sp. PCC 6802]|uniref:hypothetical protein n=1 Tax=Pseudanabaena sp. PCC 6802 TaxID=118173 RepID=UPI00034824E9|nr:hypothetical protein [Pseudanabaena sp. PCC 6802]
MWNRDDLIETKTNTITKYSVSWWEFLGISIGAVLLVGAGVVGLGMKALHNATDPRRSEAVARSIFEFQIPGGSKGVFNSQVVGIKAALIVSDTSTPDVELFVAQINAEEEIDREQLPQDLGDTMPDKGDEHFKAIATRIENKTLCGITVPVTVQEGELTWQAKASTLPAIRYIATASFKRSDRIVQLTTSGERAKQNAATIFDSLKCQ